MTTPNRPFRFDPVPPMQTADGEVHSSTRTAITTTSDAHGRQVLTIATSRLRLTVEAGTLRVGFAQMRHTAPARPLSARTRRTGVRR